MAGNGKRGEAHAAFRFAVQIEGIDEAVFSECTLPALEVDVLQQKEGGYNTGAHHLPGPVKPGRVVLKRGVSQSNGLLKWYRAVANGDHKQAERNVSVVMYDSMLNELMRWDFLRAFPVKWSGPSFNASNSAMAIESLELVFSEVAFS